MSKQTIIKIVLSSIFVLSVVYFPIMLRNPGEHNEGGMDISFMLAYLVAGLLAIIIVIAWNVYFFKRKEYISLLIVFFIAIFLLNSWSAILTGESLIEFVQNKIWLSRAQDKQYISEKFGVSFFYVSNDKTFGNIKVQEIDNKITLISDKNQNLGTIVVFSKDPSKKLLDFIKEKYLQYPGCKFADPDNDPNESIELHELQLPSQKVVQVNLSGDCPIGEKQYFLAYKGVRDKYILLSNPAQVVSDKMEYDYWFDTINLK